MTEGPHVQNDKPMCIRVWLEVGHSCEPRPRSSVGRALALDWRVWVRGVSGRDISTFVHKVVFYLRPASVFVYPKRVIQEPPYEIQESGCASIDIPIHVYLKYSTKPKKIKLRYRLHIENITQSSSETTCVYYDFENPSEQLKSSLMKGGGEVIAHTSSFMNGIEKKSLVVISGSDAKTHKHSTSKTKKYQFVEPIHCKRVKRPKIQETCPKCGDPSNVDFRKLLKSVSMTETEINLVSQLYLSYSCYEKSDNAIELPPLSDPIYRMPELPMSLRSSLTSIESEYAMQ